MKKKMKAKRPAKKVEPKDVRQRGFIRTSDFNSKKRVGFPNLHLTIAAEALTHAERARADKDAIAAYFRDLDRVIRDGRKAGDGARLRDAMVAATSYCAQILVCGESAMLNERQALTGLDHIAQFVDLKQVRAPFLNKAKRAIYGILDSRPKRRRRR